MSRQLLFDENLSPKLPALIGDQFPSSRHVRDVGLRGATDQNIWNFAPGADFTIVTKHDDFRGLSLLRGAPPKVIWLVIGNCTTPEILQVLMENVASLYSFIIEPSTALLALRKR
jgi:predicted nuclease of predicted toxin-antitoxin system